MRYIALLPAKVVYEGRRAHKVRSATEPHDVGFHGYRVDCRGCGTVAEQRERCPPGEAPRRFAPVQGEGSSRGSLFRRKPDVGDGLNSVSKVPM